MKRIVIQRVFISLGILMAVAACRSAVDSDAAAVKKAVTTYCQRLAGSYAEMNTGELADLVSPAHLDRLNHRFEALKLGDRKLEATLKNNEFIEINYNRTSSATVKTRELWHVRHLDATSGGVIKGYSEFLYTMAYVLEKKNGKWIVSSADIIEEVE